LSKLARTISVAPIRRDGAGRMASYYEVSEALEAAGLLG
jgi:hypothetical protein